MLGNTTSIQIFTMHRKNFVSSPCSLLVFITDENLRFVFFFTTQSCLNGSNTFGAMHIGHHNSDLFLQSQGFKALIMGLNGKDGSIFGNVDGSSSTAIPVFTIDSTNTWEECLNSEM